MKLSEAVREVENDRSKIFESKPIDMYDNRLRLSIKGVFI